MFARDELDEITQGLIGPMKKEMPRVPPTNDNLYNYFITRSRKNLHVVLCFSPVSVYSMQFVYNRTTFTLPFGLLAQSVEQQTIKSGDRGFEAMFLMGGIFVSQST